MKKIKYFLILAISIILCGCGNESKNIVDNFVNKVENSKSYKLDGEMKLTNGEESYTYEVNVDYKYDKYYRVKLVNTNNSHEQYILKNNENVYVITPALNKSFNFQSDWPNNSSQSYLLKSLVKDIKNTKDIKVNKKKNEYVVKAEVNYPNNSTLKYENIYFDKNSNIKRVEVLNKDNNSIIEMKFNKVKYSVNIDSNTFKLDSLVKTDDTENKESTKSTKEESSKSSNEKETSVLDNIVYPLYLPENTHLSTKDTIDTDNGDRVIMTYTGGKPFMIVEEKSKPNKEMEVTSVSGEPLLLGDAIGALTENSLEWEANNMSYYISSSYLTGEEMMTIAESLNTASVVEITNDK